MSFCLIVLCISCVLFNRHPIEDRIVDALGKKWHVEVSTANKMIII